IDIDYPRKLPCFPTTINGNINFDDFFTQFLNDTSITLKQSNKNKILTITAGQYPLNNIGDIVSFVNIQAFHLNLNNASTYASAGIVNINSIVMNWTSITGFDKSKFVLGVDFGGIVEGVSSNNIGDIDNQVIKILNVPTSWSWKNLSSQLLSPCYTSSKWVRGFDNKAKQPYIYQKLSSQSNQYYYVSYEDFQSLSAKLDFIHNKSLAGIAIFDVTKNSRNMTLTNFIASVIVIGVIGTFIFISALVASGFILYRKHKTRMPDLLIDTNKQACSDTNHQIYSDMNCQVRSDTNNQVYSDTNNK
ncbi:8065_t:CDS:2, partial [Scutellospora calospora]